MVSAAQHEFTSHRNLPEAQFFADAFVEASVAAEIDT